MPILAGFPVVEEPEPYIDPRAESRTLTLRRLDGTYPFPEPTGREFFFMPDIEGLDLPPREVTRVGVPGMDGTRLRNIRTLERDIFLPLWISSESTHLAYLEKRDALAELFSYRTVDYVTENGTFDLVASSVRGVRSLRCTYLDGMRPVKWPGEGSYWAKLGINAVACWPYWRGDDWTTPVIVQNNPIDTFDAFPLEFSTNMALGDDIPVIVPGDADSWVSVELTGPADSVTVSGDGLLFEIPAGLAAGETALIVTQPGARTALFDGVKDWARVGPATTWRPLKPGLRELTILLTDTTTASQARVFGQSWFERPW